MKKSLILTMLALAVASAAAWADDETAFRFEDYKEKTAFREAVTQQFPVGSSYLTFKGQVIRGGAEAERNILDNEAIHTYRYVKKERPTVSTNFLATWTILVTEQDDKILTISPTLAIDSNT